jgi:hypothetical protein
LAEYNIIALIFGGVVLAHGNCVDSAILLRLLPVRLAWLWLPLIMSCLGQWRVDFCISVVVPV